jgi:hypothetical protein
VWRETKKQARELVEPEERERERERKSRHTMTT